jgi:hypothetical protein
VHYTYFFIFLNPILFYSCSLFQHLSIVIKLFAAIYVKKSFLYNQKLAKFQSQTFWNAEFEKSEILNFGTGTDLVKYFLYGPPMRNLDEQYRSSA